ncbi:MAG: ATP-binding protein [Gammaproteobacteria bacterium]|nr:ATP-binding protein [Gammaproteobacteria bacterium]MYE53520.1 ATP-binding protein [Gammaproteobacteria bacterium]MYF50396.1 ATP-binding protein [Gammaproteobacteria bacterium]
MIPRSEHVEVILGRLKSFPAVAILGPRQIGKTTLARQVARQAAGPVHWLDLENPADLNRLIDDPLLVLDELRGLVVIDEVQRRPDLFPILRVLADRRPRPARFLILGSASPNMIRQSSESLAGRINYHELGGLGLEEVGYHRLNRRWLRGGFPQAWLARSNEAASLWIESFVRTFLERDLPELGLRVPSAALRRFWTMLAHWHGQVWKASEFARSFGVADTTVRRYLDILTGALVVRQLQPWHENIAKRQVKSPKLYLRDSGVLHALLGIGDMHALNAHPKCGASWEGLMLETVIEQLGLSSEQAFFWAVHTGAELDLLVPRGRHRVGIEIKRTAAPKVTRSMRTAIDDLNLQEVVVIHAGRESYRLAAKVRTVAASRLDADLGL